jgi:hypothetical protein
MKLFRSWARSTVAGIEQRLGRSDFDRILLVALVVSALAVAILFTR